MASKKKDDNDRSVELADRMRRKAYLSKMGVDPTGPFQFDLQFPTTFNDTQRTIPNDYARSSLFTARNKSTPRRTLTQEKLFHLHEGKGISMVYTGIELRAEDDEIVWLQVLHYAKGVPLGQPFDFHIKDLVRDIGWSKNGRYYDKARECISRLKANEVQAFNDKAYGKSGAISLIDKYSFVNDAEGKATHYRASIDPNLMVLFAGNTFTNHTWEIYRKLSPVARRLTDYIESHKHPFPLDIEKFMQMCGSVDTNMTSFRQTVKKACAEVQETGRVAKIVSLQKDGTIYIAR
jgi:hypothetical protein